MNQPIAIVGIACRYPDANSPAELWENILAGRRAFRRIPDERLRLEDYWSPDPDAPDKFYARKAAVIEGFEFDRVKYKIAGSTFRVTDMTHWLALDTAARALEDAGFPGGGGLPKADTTVIIGNTLTGEFNRTNSMRLRWPYVRRTVGAALKEIGWDDDKLGGFLADLEARYKSSFPPVDEDTLAGGLSNTIAGRICNQFDFRGGGFTVDGACSSSLLAVVTACGSLSEDLADAALVGGVDLSIDPFEMIGFAKLGALATSEMRVYDRHSNGFWPGEGCGMLVLMRQQDAEERGLQVYATIEGWGYSSDGKGGITRPEAAGHKLALSRAYRRAGFDITTVGYLEGHGTGTAVGDATELRAFSEARREAGAGASAAAISSIKGNIGHTKAAAGVAGLIKATMAVHHQVIPPATSHGDPHQVLTQDAPALRVPLAAELWPADQPIHAGVSAMGFGGINAHVVLAGDGAVRRNSLDSRTGAGRNEPVPLASLDEEAFRRTLAPKISGLETLLAAVDPAALKLLVTFGSIIGRAGLRGQADYATANDWLTDLTRQVQRSNLHCRCLALEWSVWSGAGMGERLGVLESLIREGISPISVDDGIELLRQLLASPRTPQSLVVMGRAGGLPTLTIEPRELPLARFIDRPRVYYPGIELVADAELSADSDPYLADHLLDGDLLFPAVLGLEAMAQAGAALTGAASPPVFENVEFLRPIVVPPDGSTTVRIVALSRGDRVDVAIRSSDTSFQADHFRATLRYTGNRPFEAERAPAFDGSPVPLDPGTDLYGGLFFQGKRFQRVLGYRQVAATSCTAEISALSADRWFGLYLPGDLLLGDPGTRDAFIHASQCCVPNATLLPAAVERLYPADPAERLEQVILTATERYRVGDTYTYDLDVRAPDGRIVERWEGLRLQAVRKTDGRGPWIPVLLGPYLERQAAELLPHRPRCVVEPDSVAVAGGRHSRREQTEAAVGRMLESPVIVSHRGDGKPEVAVDGIGVSASHGAGVTLAVTGPGRVGCDVEAVRDRTVEDWRALLGAEQFALAELIQREFGEGLSVAATRVWGAVECLRKTGRALAGPVTLARPGPAGWVLLHSGQAKIAAFCTRLRDEPDPVVFTILTEGDRPERDSGVRP